MKHALFTAGICLGLLLAVWQYGDMAGVRECVHPTAMPATWYGDCGR